jgi:hypothetical protein
LLTLYIFFFFYLFYFGWLAGGLAGWLLPRLRLLRRLPCPTVPPGCQPACL